MVQKIIERVQAHYEVHEVPFGKTYEWHRAYVTLECGCVEKVTLNTTSTILTCPQCGTGFAAFIHNIQERERHLPDKLTHPWYYDAKERAQQHQHDEAAYPQDSPWRYNDITEGI
jgi:hypothetical protein